MSLYNALFGTNPYSTALLMTLGISEAGVPRFRDCYLNDDGNIVVYTRTGGGNRDFYESEESCRENYPEYFSGKDEPSGPWNSDLRKIPGFLEDEDDDFDCTYARFIFAPSTEFSDAIKEIQEKQGKRDPAEAFEQLISDLRSGQETPETKRARDVAKRIFGQIDKGNGIVEV